MKRSCVIVSSIISVILGGFGIVGAVSALEYQTNPSSGDNPVTLKFEFGQTLTISTDGNISIASLTPGTKAISNSNYNVTVSTNNLTGYTLSATVGCSSGTDCYDSKNLSDGTNTFSMLSTDGALTAGTWGVSLDSSATANSNFKTLAKYDETATIINQTTSNTGTAATGYAGTSATTVRIGAYATNSQVAGTYTNSINFIAVANAAPTTISDLTYMQDFATLSSSDKTSVLNSMPEGRQYQLKDSRDQKDYYISRLADGNVWMTQNLDHDIVAEANYYTPQNTDIPAAWTPSTATYATGTTTWNGSLTAPESYDPGNLCWNGILDYNGETTLDDGTVVCGSDKHMSIGNYYNWTSAVAMNSTSSYADADANQSICPAGWRLPIDGNDNTGSRSFQYLWNQYSSFDNEAVMNSPLYFSYAGLWDGSSHYVGSSGLYRSSVVYNYNSSYILYFATDVGVITQARYFREEGYSVRCVAR